MVESILGTIKPMVGGVVDGSDTAFDTDIIVHINTALATLCQLGVGPARGFNITGMEETWDDFVPNRPDLAMLKSYVYMRVLLLFDTSGMNTGLVNSWKESVKEMEWRLRVAATESGGD